MKKIYYLLLLILLGCGNTEPDVNPIVDRVKKMVEFSAKNSKGAYQYSLSIWCAENNVFVDLAAIEEIYKTVWDTVKNKK